ncbi:MAG TPA: hypothetical protein VKB89_22155 [Xanthobacteraceae bacterium]|nr:hypothetical protein [Xanthobacteraceae bacterium]
MIARIDARVAEGKAVIFLTYHCTNARASRKMWHENQRAQSPEGQDCRCQGRRQPRATPEYLAQFVKSEIEMWAAPIKASGVTVD